MFFDWLLARPYCVCTHTELLSEPQITRPLVYCFSAFKRDLQRSVVVLGFSVYNNKSHHIASSHSLNVSFIQDIIGSHLTCFSFADRSSMLALQCESMSFLRFATYASVVLLSAQSALAVGPYQAHDVGAQVRTPTVSQFLHSSCRKQNPLLFVSSAVCPRCFPNYLLSKALLTNTYIPMARYLSWMRCIGCPPTCLLLLLL